MTSFYRSYGGRGMTRTNAVSVKYRGFLIYHVKDGYGVSGAAVYDVVYLGICVGQYAGPQGARKAIERYLNDDYLWNREVWDAARIAGG